MSVIISSPALNICDASSGILYSLNQIPDCCLIFLTFHCHDGLFSKIKQQQKCKEFIILLILKLNFWNEFSQIHKIVRIASGHFGYLENGLRSLDGILLATIGDHILHATRDTLSWGYSVGREIKLIELCIAGILHSQRIVFPE